MNHRSPQSAYRYDGADYEGTRVSLFEDANSIGSYQQVAHNRLRAALDADRPVPCYGNPDDPAESILMRKPHWGAVVFLLVVACVSGVLLGIGATLHLTGRPISLVPLQRLVQSLLPGARTPDTP